jgi:hippurate hydrolase
MPILNRAVEMQPEIAGWRRFLHETPELMFDVHETARFVAERLTEFGCDSVTTGIGRTGVVGIIKGMKGAGPTIGLRADMDALPILEASGKPWSSKNVGSAHSCGHDGHTAMLLGAAKYLAETRNFAGTVAVIFQPAEEGGGGGRAMVQDGMMETFGISEVYGLHNKPGIPLGSFVTRPGPVMAASDTFEIVVTGSGAHASQPHLGIDPVIAAAHVVIALQGLVSRQTDPLESLVVSVTTTHGGTATNVIPSDVTLTGTVRTLTPATRDFAEKRLGEVASAAASLYGATAKTTYSRGYPVTKNHDAQTAFAAGIARKVAGATAVDDAFPPVMGAEDFSYMLEARPGAFLFLGIGDNAPLHHPAYDFNDEAIPHGVSYWVALAETALAAR